MGKPQHRVNPRALQALEDLSNYLEFCRDYGYVYDERNLYNERSPYGEFLKMKKGREPWDQWRSPRRERTDFRPRNTNGNYQFRAR